MTIGTPPTWMRFGLFARVAPALDFFALGRQRAQGSPLSRQHHTALRG
jgi:hypothetical protein